MLMCEFERQFGEENYPKEIAAASTYAVRDTCRQLEGQYNFRGFFIVQQDIHGAKVTGLATMQTMFKELTSVGVRSTQI